MAEKFKFPSVYQFAVDILRKKSAHRLALLQQYYTSLNLPDLADTVKKNFPQPVSAQASPSAAASETTNPQKNVSEVAKNATFAQKNPRTSKSKASVPQKKARSSKRDTSKPRKKQRISQRNVLEPLSDVPSPESEEQDETVRGARGLGRTKGGGVSTSGAHVAGGGLGGARVSSSGLGSGEAAACLNCTDRDAPSSSDLSHGSSTVVSKPTAQGREQRENSQAPSVSTNRSFLTDLIGDTSILDDLLKPKSKSTKLRSAPKTPSPGSATHITPPPSTLTPDPSSGLQTQTAHQFRTSAQAPKGGRKDFWEILNEGNEERINRLTDPEEVQRVCVTTNFAARTASAGKESRSLWKTNEKFLWKK